MDKRKPMLRLLAEAVDVPRELLPGEPLIELVGNQRVMIENHTGILAYSCSCICVQICGGSISVQGKNLTITRMRHKQLVIVGTISGIEIDREGVI